MQRFGEKLRWLRNQQQMTQRALADRLGFAAQSYINALETGKKRPSVEVVFRIAKVFNVTTDQLLDDTAEVWPDGTTEQPLAEPPDEATSRL